MPTLFEIASRVEQRWYSLSQMRRRPALRASRTRRYTVGVTAALMLQSLASGQQLPAGPGDQATTRIRELQTEADTLAKESGTLLNELRALELQRQIKTQEVQKAEATLAQLNTAQKTAETRLAALDAERIATTPFVDERLVEIYKRGRGGYLRLLLQSNDLRQLGRLSRGVASVARLDRIRFDAHRRTLRAEQDTMKELDARRVQAATARDAAVRARQALDAAVAAHNRRIDEIDKRRDLAAQYAGELQSAQTGLEQRVAATARGATSLPILPFRGTLEWPVNGRVLSRFGRGAADRLGMAVVRNGIEIATIEAQQVRAVHGGTVSYAAAFAGFGTLVIIDHGTNAFSLYGHLSQTLVTAGTTVDRGRVIGLAGRSPAGTQSLYFELRIDGRPVDPVQWFRSPR